MIEIRHLTKSYGNVTPLRDISTTIRDGDVIGIIGPSGTGKSTLLKCLNMLEPPTSGEIIVDGVNITDPKCDLAAVRRKMGMVFQSFNLFSHMNVIENITYAPIKLLGLSRDEAYERGRTLLRAVCLADKEQVYPDELSGGQQQRIAIARTLAMKPEIILFDEPTSALDPTMIAEVLAVIKGLADRGLTMLIVTHRLRFARDISNRVFYMDQAGIYEDGSPEQIFEHPQKELTRRFILKQRAFEKTVMKKGFDLIGILSETETFIRGHLLSQQLSYRVQVILEELLLQTVIPAMGDADRLRFTLTCSESDPDAFIDFIYKPANARADVQWDPIAQMSELSQKLVMNTAEDIRMEGHTLHIRLKG